MQTDAYKTVDEYLSSIPEQRQQVKKTLTDLRNIIRTVVPEAEELISYQLPAYRYYGMLVHFGLFKEHYSLFVNPAVMEVFRDKLSAYRLSKSTIQFPEKESFPVDLIEEIILFSAKLNYDKYLSKQKSVKKNRNL